MIKQPLNGPQRNILSANFKISATGEASRMEGPRIAHDELLDMIPVPSLCMPMVAHKESSAFYKKGYQGAT